MASAGRLGGEEYQAGNAADRLQGCKWDAAGEDLVPLPEQGAPFVCRLRCHKGRVLWMRFVRLRRIGLCSVRLGKIKLRHVRYASVHCT
jgi:hypothetical protein